MDDEKLMMTIEKLQIVLATLKDAEMKFTALVLEQIIMELNDLIDDYEEL